jgi:DNA-binding MarR family transcriptional regulator
MPSDEVVDALEAIAVGSVAITNAALERVGGEGLSFEQWRAILIVGEDERGTRISEVARRVTVTVPATSRLLRRLQRRGLVSLAQDPDDRRATLCRLTTRGAALRAAVLADRRTQLTAVAARADLSPSQASVITNLGDAFIESS